MWFRLHRTIGQGLSPSSVSADDEDQEENGDDRDKPVYHGPDRDEPVAHAGVDDPDHFNDSYLTVP